MSFDIDSLIYDRTAQDVASGADKGHYNATDLNRVGEALNYLQEELNGYGYSVTVNPKINWTVSDIPKVSDMSSYLDAVSAIRAVLDVFATTPAVPSTMQGLTYERANDIEKILADVQSVIDQVVAGFWRSNAFTMWSGSDHLPSSYSDIGRNWGELDAMGTTWSNWQVANWYLLLYGNLQAEGAVT